MSNKHNNNNDVVELENSKNPLLYFQQSKGSVKGAYGMTWDVRNPTVPRNKQRSPFKNITGTLESIPAEIHEIVKYALNCLLECPSQPDDLLLSIPVNHGRHQWTYRIYIVDPLDENGNSTNSEQGYIPNIVIVRQKVYSNHKRWEYV